jgi:FkbM family methyltransferase
MNRVKHQVLHGLGRVTSRFRGDVSFVKRRNLRWALSKNNLIDRHLLNGYYFEPDRLQRCIEYINSYGIQTFLDVGANFGLYAIHLARNAPLKHIHAFEPVRQNFNQLCANIFINRLDRVITSYNIGLSNEDSTRTIYVDTSHTGLSKFHDWSPPVTKKTMGREYYGEVITVRRLDSILDWTGRPTLAKIDVEGHEAEVIEGMASLLSRNKHVLQIEIQPENEKAIRERLSSMNYIEIGQLGADRYFSNF